MGPLTPYQAAKALVALDSLEVEDTPSHGAVAAIFKRWEQEGKALFMNDPFAFVTWKS
jgi:hypothetical protein